MRIVVSGTHASGKSTLVSDLAAALPDHEVYGDPFDLVDDDLDPVSVASFVAQLEVTCERLDDLPPGSRAIVERGPVDLLAYLEALADLGRASLDRVLLDGLRGRAARSMAHVDLWVVLPLRDEDGIHVPADEDLALRDAMDERLLDLVDDDELVGGVGWVVEVAGPPAERVAAVLAALADRA